MFIYKLIRIGGDPLVLTKPKGLMIDSKHGSDLIALLSEKNGFYAFESALHVLPSHGPSIVNLENWNSEELWKSEYGDLAKGLFFFAEDAFGGQFAIGDNGVFSFDPETGKRQRIAPDLEGWADCILTDYSYLTGYPLAHEWQKKNGPLRADCRLLPRIPCVCGGQYTLDNLVMVGAVEGMKWRADLARQIKDLPDGSQIQLKVLKSEAS